MVFVGNINQSIDAVMKTSQCGASLRKPLQSQMVVLGNMSIGGTINKVEELATSFYTNTEKCHSEFGN